MNNSKTPKVVVAVGLVALYATGFTILTLRDRPDAVVAQGAAVTPPEQIDAAPVTPTEIAPESTDAANSVLEQPAAPAIAAAPAVAPAPAPAAVPAPAARVAERIVSTPAPRSEPVEAKPAIEEQVSPVVPATVAAATPAESPATEPANEPSEVASTASEPAAHGDDSQITADVKSKIAAVAPEGAIDVTTKDGVVELAGSVPSQEVIDMARLVASNVADVRRVDVSGLMIGN